MGKIKDIFTGEHRKFAWFVVISTSLFLLSWLIGPGNTIIHWVKARNEISSQEKQMEVYRAQIDEMNQNIEELADLLEVVYAATIARGYTIEQLEKVLAEKAEKRGAFQKKILLVEVTED